MKLKREVTVSPGSSWAMMYKDLLVREKQEEKKEVQSRIHSLHLSRKQSGRKVRGCLHLLVTGQCLCHDTGELVTVFPPRGSARGRQTSYCVFFWCITWLFSLTVSIYFNN